MELFFGLGIALSLVGVLPVALLLFLGFVYVRAQRGQPFTIGTGLTLYTSVLLGVSAVVIAIGLGLLLTALTAQIDEEYTYGPTFDFGSSDDDFDFETPGDNRSERDSAAGLGLVVGGAIAASVHIWLRTLVRRKDLLDAGAEGAVETVMAFLFGIISVVLVGATFQSTFQRAIADDQGVTPGGTIAQMWAFLALWAVYGLQVLRRSRVFERGPASI